MRWGVEVREQAADLFEQGLGYRAVATSLGMKSDTTREWAYVWRALGRDGLCTIGLRREYDPQVKIACARARIEDGLSMVDTMRKFGVANRRQVMEWCGLYQEGGVAAFGLDPEGAVECDLPSEETLPAAG